MALGLVCRSVWCVARSGVALGLVWRSVWCGARSGVATLGSVSDFRSSIFFKHLYQAQLIMFGVCCASTGLMWNDYENARWCAVRDGAPDKLYALLADPAPEVRGTKAPHNQALCNNYLRYSALTQQ